jgi:branched-chain amino acid transport system permease protein
MRQILVALAAAILVAFVLVVPALANNYLLQVATTLGMSIILCLSWNIVGGTMGYPSFGTAAFFGIGAYVCGISANSGIPLVVSWCAAAVAGAIVAAFLGAVLLGLKGHYFAIGTIAVVVVARELAVNCESVTGGAVGLNLPFFTGTPREAGLLYYTGMWGLAAISFCISFTVAHTRFGFGLRCIKQNEAAAKMVGVNVFAYKVWAFTLSALMASAAGGCYASMVSFIEPNDAFNIVTSIEIPVMVMLGGAGTLVGPLIGATTFAVLNEFVWINFISFHTAILGLLIVFIIYMLPNGIFGALQRLWARAPDHRNRAPTIQVVEK